MPIHISPLCLRRVQHPSLLGRPLLLWHTCTMSTNIEIPVLPCALYQFTDATSQAGTERDKALKKA